jgi:glycosyltransferase involved in cell wall biosynthesis
MKLPRTAKKEYDLISISHYFPPRIGGLENMTFTLLKELSKKNIKCMAVFGSNQRYEMTEDGFRKVSFKPINIFENTYPIFGITFFLNIFNIIKQNPDAKIIVHSRHLTSSFITHIVCLMLSRPYTLIEHNAGKVYMSSTFATKFVNWLDRNIFRSVITNAQDIIAVSRTGKKWISKNFGIEKERIKVIYNSYDITIKDIDLKGKKNIVVWAGKWIKVKNPRIVLNTYLQLATKYPKWLFMIIGEGSALKIPSTKLPENIRIVDRMLSQKDLFNLLEESKIYINSSFSEGLAIANLEAVALGNIPVLSNAPSNVEVAKLIGSGEFVFRRNSTRDLSKTVEKAIIKSSNTTFIKGIMKENEKIFSKDEMIKKYYEMLLPEHHTNENLKTISIVIPVYNEEKTVIQILQKVSKLKFPNKIEKEIILVDDGSKDKSKELINEYIRENKDTKIVLLENRKNLGKSQTVKKGVLESTGDLVVTQDADLEYDPKDLIKFTKIFLSNPYINVIYGNRFNRKNNFNSSVHSLGNKFITYLSNLFTRNNGFAPKDMETCYKMIRGDISRGLFRSLESTSNFGLEPEITAKLSRYRKLNGNKLQFKEVDISYIPRTVSQGKKMRWFKNGLEALLEILYFNTNSFVVEEIKRDKRVVRRF